jgi:hypothetical protein
VEAARIVTLVLCINYKIWLKSQGVWPLFTTISPYFSCTLKGVIKIQMAHRKELSVCMSTIPKAGIDILSQYIDDTEWLYRARAGGKVRYITISTEVLTTI